MGFISIEMVLKPRDWKRSTRVSVDRGVGFKDFTLGQPKAKDSGREFIGTEEKPAAFVLKA